MKARSASEGTVWVMPRTRISGSARRRRRSSPRPSGTATAAPRKRAMAESPRCSPVRRAMDRRSLQR